MKITNMKGWFILLMLTLFLLVTTGYVMAAPWANSSFDRCRNITLNNSVGSVLSNFPVYVSLPYDSDMQPNFVDVRFYNTSCNNGGSLLSYEIENFSSSVNAHVWVRIPSLATGVNVISVYYGNNTAVSSGQNVSGVWDSNYRMVQHLDERSGAHFDSTRYGNNMSATVISQGSAVGVVDGADDYERDNLNDATVAYSASLDLNAYTIEAWTQIESVGAQRGILGTRFGSDNTFDLKWEPTSLHGDIGSGSAWLSTAADYTYTPVAGTWYHVVYVVYTNGYQIYLNGNLGITGSYTGTPELMKSGETMHIGNSYSTEYFDGIMDEIRISSVSRSADWINQTYKFIANQSRYVIQGTEESRDVFIDYPPNVSLSYPPDNHYNDTSQYVNLTLNASVVDDVNLRNCSLWTDHTGIWLLNQTQNIGGKTNVTWFNLTGLTNRVFVWNIKCYDNVSQASFASANRTITINWSNPTVDNPPFVTLSYPPNGYMNDSARFINLTFNASVTDDINLKNCSLWTNYSGSWQRNQTQGVTGKSAIASFDMIDLTNKTFKWNIQCYDNASQPSFSFANRTVILDWIPPPNQPPVVTSVWLIPEYPIPSNDLYCDFIVEDADDIENLTVNVSWYKNGIFNLSQSMNVDNGTLSGSVLGSGNLSVGQTWFCSVIAYDQQNYSVRVNSSSVTILSSLPPIVSDVFLNSTSFYNFSSGNLTCNYSLSGNVTTSAVSWFRNSTPFMLLYMPFEGNFNNALKDYSGLGDNATDFSVTWNATGGYGGKGAFMFDGINDYLLTSYAPSLSSIQNWTYSFWIYTKSYSNGLGSDGAGVYFLDRSSATSGLTSLKAIGGKFAFQKRYDDSSGLGAVSSKTSIAINTWQYVTVVRKSGSVFEIYVNGVFENSTADTGAALTVPLPKIGGHATACPGVGCFNGTIDDLRFYTYSLSPQQIWALYQNKSNTIVSQELTAGDIWQCRATPFSNTAAGSIQASNNLTVVDGPLVFLDAPQNNYYNDTSRFVNLTFNASVVDDVSLRNCSLWTNYSGSWQRNQTQNVSGLNNVTFFTLNGLTNKTFVWNVQCYDNSGRVSSASENSTLRLNWSARLPVIDYIAVDDDFLPEGQVILSAGSAQSVNCTIVVSDPDGVDAIFNASARLYYYLNRSSDPDDNTVHYTNSSCNLTANNSVNKTFTCGFSVLYYANNGVWQCNATVYTIYSGSASANASTAIQPLYAVNITDGMAFGNVPAGSVSSNLTVNITNFGNMPINITIQGYAVMIGDMSGMNCSDGSNITITNIRFSTNATANFSQKTFLDGTIQSLSLNINRQVNTTVMFNTTYWQLMPDPGIMSRICGGYVIFTAEAS